MKSIALYAGLIVFMLFGGMVLAEDPDYGNEHTSAFAIDADGSVTFGDLESGGYDWFTFDNSGDTRFRITFSNGEGNWKLIRFYQANEFGDPVEVASWWQGGVGSTYRTFFIEHARPCYLRIENEPGSYSVKVETLGTNPADSYGNDCNSATPIVVDAPETLGTLDHTDPLNYDHDWFVFSTEPLHTYHVRLWYLDNCNVWFYVMNDTCGTQIYGSTTDMTMTSWYGDDVKIHVEGDVNRSGNLYWLEVTDVGTYPDDHGNTWDVSTPIPADGTKIEAMINYNATVNSDIDWFRFTPQAHSKYDITFANGEGNWKLIRVYQVNEFGDPVEIDAWWQGGVTEGFHTHFFEYSRPCYLKFENEGGRYSFNVKYLETKLPDAYSNSCDTPTETAANGQAVIGTLDHTNPYDNDWFVFHTQPLHQYQIQLGYLNNCNVWFEVYSAGCSNVYGGTTSMTLTSLKGEDYKIRVNGDTARVGNYYTLTVTDIGTYTDDHGNVSAEATAIPKDNTPVAGSINYTSSINSDLDWMTFVAGQEGDYQFTLENTVSNWKLMRIYYEDEAGHVYEIAAFWAGGITSVTNTYHLLPRRHYIRIENEPGEYFVRVLSPEPRCGDLDHPIMAGDINKDCRVNLQDMAMMAANWLECNHPTLCN